MLEPLPQEDQIDEDHFEKSRGIRDLTLDDRAWKEAMEDSDEDIDIVRPPRK